MFCTVFAPEKIKEDFMVTAEQFKKIKLILTDIDGVLTDGRVGYGSDVFIKFFNLFIS